MKKISVIIPLNDISQLSDSFFTEWYEQTLAMTDFELIIVTSDSKQSKFINQLYRKLLYSKPPELEIHFIYENIATCRSKAMNLGILKSQSPLLYLFGDDFIPSKNTLEEHLAFHQQNPSNNEVGIGLGFVPKKYRSGFVDWLEESGSLFGIPIKEDLISIPNNFFYMANTSIKKEFILKAGLFDEDFKYHCWDDWELSLRLIKLNMKSTLINKSNAIHNHDITIQKRFEAMKQAGESCWIYENKYPLATRPWKNLLDKNIFYQKLKVQFLSFFYEFLFSKKIEKIYFREKMNLGFLIGYKIKNQGKQTTYSYAKNY